MTMKKLALIPMLLLLAGCSLNLDNQEAVHPSSKAVYSFQFEPVGGSFAREPVMPLMEWP
jgi:outer membrane lipopolysaccharide assembly protein LptE/RlpB